MGYVIGYLMFWALIATTNALKGKWWSAVLLSPGLVGCVTAVRLAKPGSWYARSCYGNLLTEQAHQRFR